MRAGHTYERLAIEAWLANHKTSPMTDEPLLNKSLISNHALLAAIADARQAR